jgi:hypothetical protein
MRVTEERRLVLSCPEAIHQAGKRGEPLTTGDGPVEVLILLCDDCTVLARRAGLVLESTTPRRDR